jgi:hypothetical protein
VAVEERRPQERLHPAADAKGSRPVPPLVGGAGTAGPGHRGLLLSR